MDSGLREKALRLLAQREHSRAELTRKLAARTEDQEEIPALLDHLEQVGLLSDRRFAESFVRAHAARSGMARLRYELRLKGVADEVAQAALASELDGDSGTFGDELTRASSLWQRKFGEPPADARAYGRQARFLQGRGFSADIIHKLLKHSGD